MTGPTATTVNIGLTVEGCGFLTTNYLIMQNEDMWLSPVGSGEWEQLRLRCVVVGLGRSSRKCNFSNIDC